MRHRPPSRARIGPPMTCSSGCAAPARSRPRRTTATSTSLAAAIRTANHLSGTRAYELNAVLANIHDIADTGELTTSRLPALFLTLDRNRTWWSTGPLLSPSQRVEFSGSELVWQYYPGQGLELQELGSFGKATGSTRAAASSTAGCGTRSAELIPLAAAGAAHSSGSTTSTSTAAPRRGRARCRRARRCLRSAGHSTSCTTVTTSISRGEPCRSSAIGRRRAFRSGPSPRPSLPALFVCAQPERGRHQRLPADADRAQRLRADERQARAARLFAAGDREARAEVPHYDTGRWSLYQPGELSSSTTTCCHRLPASAVPPHPRAGVLHDGGPVRAIPEARPAASLPGSTSASDGA